jgi:hypothetical protein
MARRCALLMTSHRRARCTYRGGGGSGSPPSVAATSPSGAITSRSNSNHNTLIQFILTSQLISQLGGEYTTNEKLNIREMDTQKRRDRRRRLLRDERVPARIAPPSWRPPLPEPEPEPEPKTQVDRTLLILSSMNGAREAAVFAVSGGRLSLFASSGVTQAALDRVQTVWVSRRKVLGGGRPVRLDSAFVAPLSTEGEMVGLLYLDRRDLTTCPDDDFARLERIVARAMRALAPQLVGRGIWTSVLEQTPLQEIVRDQMLLLLDRHEWNIARVARELGVTRRTIYLRLARWGIERRKIPRSV